MRTLFLVFFVLLTSHLHARPLDKCGVYDVDAYYLTPAENKEGKAVFLLNRDSESEIRFYVKNPNIAEIIPDSFVGVNFRLKLRFTVSCYYHCEGRIEEVLGPLDPFQYPRLFFHSRQDPIAGTEIKCDQKSK